MIGVAAVEIIVMSSNPNAYTTPAEYLVFERASETKHEYIDGEIIAMSGAKAAHNLVKEGIAGALYPQLRRRPCYLFTSDQRVALGRGALYTYPDVVVTCGEPQYQDAELDTLLNPTLIAEVLSPSTEAYDRGEKFNRYRQIETLQEYVLVAQDQPRIEHFLRQPSGKWLYTAAVSLETVLELSSIGCTLALADVYEKVTFGQQT